MKTNKIFLSLLCGSVMAVVATSCSTPEPEIIPGDDIITVIEKHDTINIPILAVNTIEICADKSSQVINFEAASDWTWKLDATASWMTATKTSGVKAEGKLEFNVTENTDSRERRAVTTLTMSGHDNKLIIVQKGTAPYVEVYNGEITLGKDMTEAYITNIVSNVDIKVKSFPKWIETVDLESLDDYPGAHQAFVVLKPWNFEDGVRTGAIRFESSTDPSIFKEYTIKCAAFTDDYIVNSNRLSGKPGEVDTLLGQNSVPAVPVSHDFFVYSKPAAAEFSVVILDGDNPGSYTYQGIRNEANVWSSAAVLDSRAVYSEKTVRITCTNFLAPNSFSTKLGAVYVMPTTEVEAFMTRVKAAGTKGVNDAPNFVFVQGRYNFIEKISPKDDPRFIAGVPSQIIFKVKVRQGLPCNYKFKENYPPQAVDYFSVDKSEPVTANGWDTYTLTVDYDGRGDVYNSVGFQIWYNDETGPDADFEKQDFIDYNLSLYNAE